MLPKPAPLREFTSHSGQYVWVWPSLFSLACTILKLPRKNIPQPIKNVKKLAITQPPGKVNKSLLILSLYEKFVNHNRSPSDTRASEALFKINTRNLD